MAIVPLRDVWVTANFKETQLAHMRPGMPVRVKSILIVGENGMGMSPTSAARRVHL